MPMPSTSKTSLPNPLRSVSDSFPPVPDFPDAAVPVSAPVSAPSEIPAPPCEPQGPKQANPAHEELRAAQGPPAAAMHKRFRRSLAAAAAFSIRERGRETSSGGTAAEEVAPAERVASRGWRRAFCSPSVPGIDASLLSRLRWRRNGNRTRVHYLERNSALFDAERRGHSLVLLLSRPRVLCRMRRTDVVYRATSIGIRTRYAMPGTDVAE
eukprot:1244869-Rhodomonas_salina.2